jgi:hypothetical protein
MALMCPSRPMPKASDLTARRASRWIVWTMLWAASMTASASISLYWTRSGIIEGAAYRLIGVFALGAMLAFPVARYVLTFVPGRWRFSQRFAIAFLILGAATLGITALLVAFDFLAYYAQWHDDGLSRRRFFDTVTTILSACYQFLVLGLRLFLPVGFASLIAASWVFALRRL